MKFQYHYSLSLLVSVDTHYTMHKTAIAKSDIIYEPKGREALLNRDTNMGQTS